MNALSDVSDKFNPFNAMVVAVGERRRFTWVFSVQLMQSSYCFNVFNFNVYFNSNKSHKHLASIL